MQATRNFSYNKFGKPPIFAPESRTKFGATFSTGSCKLPRCHAARSKRATKTA